MEVIPKHLADSITCPHAYYRCKTVTLDEGAEAHIRYFDIAPAEAKIDVSKDRSLYFSLQCAKGVDRTSAQGVAFCSISSERNALLEKILSTFKFLD